MSFEYYTTWWIKSRKNTEKLIEKDEAIRKSFKPINGRNLANELIGGLYARYCMLVQDLSACVDQMAQPQKRIAVKKLVDSACIRLNELNDELKTIDLSEFHYIDGNLVELKLIPTAIEILHPCLFHHRPVDVEKFIEKIKRGEKIFVPPVPTVIIEDVIEPDEKAKDGNLDASKSTNEDTQKKLPRPSALSTTVKKPRFRLPSDLDPNTIQLTPQQLAEQSKKAFIKHQLLLIQTAERGRQSRVYFLEKITLTLERAKIRIPGYKPPPEATPEEKHSAAVTIQKVWRGYEDRQALKRNEEKRRLLIGMNVTSYKSRKEFEIFEANLEKRRVHVSERISEYVDAISNEKSRILRVVAPGLLEDIEDEIREWFHQWYVGAKTFDKYPTVEKGGTILVVRGETMTPKEYLDEYEKKRRAKVKAGGKDAQKEKEKREKERLKKLEAEKKKKEAERKKKEALAKKKKKKKPGDYEYEEFAPTLAKPVRDLGETEMKKIWDLRNDFENPEEKHYMDLITEEKCHEVQLEVRTQADELMRLELEMLEEALAKDKGKKYKKKKEKKKKKKKGKRKGKKDITADRAIEDLFQELVDNNLIRTYPKVGLEDFHGDFSYKNQELRRKGFDPPTSMLDVRQAVTLLCIQPLGVEVMKKPKSVLIAGPAQCGKHLLSNAVFNHTKCVLFDLTPENTADKYPGAKGLTMLIHLISKMSKILQPSVIFVDGVERIFYKKVPKEEKDLDPKRIGKKIIKGIIKAIKPADRVLVLGTSSAPWLGQTGKMKKAFDRVIFVPRPDYGSVYMFWRELLTPYHSVDRNFNFTSLATVTKYYPYPVLKDLVKNFLTARRIITLKIKPLQPNELYEYLVVNQIEPITDKVWKKWLKWYFKTPLGKLRNKLNKWNNKQREIEANTASKTRK